MTPKLIIIGLVALLLNGCVPIPIPHSGRVAPTFQGRVIDAQTQKPLQGVEVQVLSFRTEEPLFSVITDFDGRYKAEKKKLKFFYPLWLGPAEGLKGGTVVFKKSGYRESREKRSRFGGANSYPTFEINSALEKEKPNRVAGSD